MDIEVFRNPPKQFRPSPFWSWNDKLEDAELERQIRDMKEKGFGGYFMHSRGGLITEYMSEDWMRRVATCIRVGREVDMESWLYDEDRWPSGAAGGLIPARDPSYRAHILWAVPQGAEEPPGEKVTTLGVFAVHRDETGAVARVQRLNGAAPAHAEVWRFQVHRGVNRNWFNGEAYVDLLNPDVTEAFLKSTHDAYYERFGEDFGEFVPGIFTDEPQYPEPTPWAPGFDAVFKDRNGYDLLNHLPFLFLDGPGAAKVRYDFRRTATERFIEAWTQPVSDWCKRHGLAMTGHYQAEDDLLRQISAIGAAMPHYEYMQVPGIDHLCRNIEHPLTPKQVSSVAHQFGRKRVLCEIFGVSGHSMSFEDQKWIADWHFALGITFINQHLALYSMKGCRKRDFPPTFSYHQPYWPHYRVMNDYFARCAYALSQGEHQCDILLLHPIASAWTAYRAPVSGRRQDNEEAAFYNDQFTSLFNELLCQQRDFDLGDEMIMERHGRVEGAGMAVGRATYQLVIMPPSLNWASSTLGLLKDYVAAGGKLLVLGSAPSLIDGEPSDELESFLSSTPVSRAPNDAAALREALDRLLPPRVQVRTRDGDPVPDVLVHERRAGRLAVYFFANTSREDTWRTTITLKTAGSVRLWHPEDGTTSELAARDEGGQVTIEHEFSPVGSLLVVVDTQGVSTAVEGAEPAKTTEEVIPISGPWDFSRTHPNSLVLDFGRIAFDDGDFGDVKPVWKLRRQALAHFGLDKYQEIQPWRLHQLNPPLPKDARVRLSFEFHAHDAPRQAALVVEQAERWRLEVNGRQVQPGPAALRGSASREGKTGFAGPRNPAVPGRRVSTHVSRWHWDRQFGRVDITGAAVQGLNTIEMQAPFDLDTEIEDVYLVGDFGVSASDGARLGLVHEPKHLEDGDWTRQGYPFYAGNMVYKRSFPLTPRAKERYLLRLTQPRGALFLVRLNGQSAGTLSWQPWQADITPLVREGDNELEIEVVGTLRNTFGPLHHDEGEALRWVSPAAFEDETHWTDAYQLAPYGLLKGAQIAIRRD